MNILKAKLILFGSIICLFANYAISFDLGEFGETFPILEKDLLEVIMGKLQMLQDNGQLAEHQQHIQNKIKARILEPKAQELPETTKQREFYYDPTITVAEDLTDGQGKVFKTKGETINPLDMYSFRGTWVFFDATSSKQREFALSLKAENLSKLILTKGKPLELMQQWQTPIYFDQFGWLVKKFGIQQVPAIVRQDGKKLKIIEQDLKLWQK